jgi:hypothetical protein
MVEFTKNKFLWRGSTTPPQSRSVRAKKQSDFNIDFSTKKKSKPLMNFLKTVLDLNTYVHMSNDPKESKTKYETTIAGTF